MYFLWVTVTINVTFPYIIIRVINSAEGVGYEKDDRVLPTAFTVAVP